MFIQRTTAFGIILLAFAGLMVNCAKMEKVVALVGRDSSITLKEFRESYSSTNKKMDSKQKPGLDILKKHLDGMIDQKVMLMAAYETGMDKDTSVVNKIKPYKESILLDRLFKKEILEPVVREPDVRNYYTHTGKEVFIRMILFKLPPQNKPEDEQKIKTKASDVLRRIHAGEDFGVLAKKYSEDERTASKGGLVGVIQWKNDPVQKAAFSMKEGGVSDLVKNNFGYNIIKVDSIREKKREPFEKVKEQIQNQLYNERQGLILERRKTYLDQLMTQYHVIWSDTTMNQFTQYLSRFISKDLAVFQDSLRRMNPKEQEAVLVTYKGGKVTVQDVVIKLSSIKGIEFPRQLGNKDGLKSYIGSIWLGSKFLVEVALKQDLEKDKSVKDAIRSRLERAMVDRLVEKEVIQGIGTPTDEDLQKYYEAKKNEKYMGKEMVKIQEVLVDNKKLADQIYNWALTGTSFKTLVQKYTTRPGYKEKNGIFDYFRRGSRWGEMGLIAFDLKTNEISKPIYTGNNQYSVIKLLDKKIPPCEPFEQVKPKVIRDWQKDSESERRAYWLAAIRKKFGVKIYENVLEHAFDQT